MTDDTLLGRDDIGHDDLERQGQLINRRNFAINQIMAEIARQISNQDLAADLDAPLLMIGVMSALANAMATSAGLPEEDIIEVIGRSAREQKPSIPPGDQQRIGEIVLEAMTNRRNGEAMFQAPFFDPVARRPSIMQFSLVRFEEDRSGRTRFVFALTDQGVKALVGMLDSEESEDVRFHDLAIRRAIDRGHYHTAVTSCIRQTRRIQRLLQQMGKQIDLVRLGASLQWDETFGSSIEEITSDIREGLDRTSEIRSSLSLHLDRDDILDDVRKSLRQAMTAVSDLFSTYSLAATRISETHQAYVEANLDRIQTAPYDILSIDLQHDLLKPYVALDVDEAIPVTETARAGLLPIAPPSFVDAGGIIDFLWDDLVALCEKERLELLLGENGDGADAIDDIELAESFDPVAMALATMRLTEILEEVVISMGNRFDMTTLLERCERHPKVSPEDLPFLRKLAFTWPAKARDNAYGRTDASGEFSTPTLAGENTGFVFSHQVRNNTVKDAA